MWIAWGFALPSIAALVFKMIRPDRPLLVKGRTHRLPAGHDAAVGRRPHQSHLQELLGPAAAGGGDAVQRAGSRSCRGGIRAAPADKNCSFFSGEGATAFWTYAPAALAPAPWRPLAYAAATVFGIATSGLRMAFGGHFFTDVAVAGLVTFLVIWLAFAMIYRWQRTRLSDERIDAALTRFAWPLYRRWRGQEAGPAPSASH